MLKKGDKVKFNPDMFNHIPTTEVLTCICDEWETDKENPTQLVRLNKDNYGFGYMLNATEVDKLIKVSS